MRVGYQVSKRTLFLFCFSLLVDVGMERGIGGKEKILSKHRSSCFAAYTNWKERRGIFFQSATSLIGRGGPSGVVSEMLRVDIFIV